MIMKDSRLEYFEGRMGRDACVERVILIMCARCKYDVQASDKAKQRILFSAFI